MLSSGDLVHRIVGSLSGRKESCSFVLETAHIFFLRWLAHPEHICVPGTLGFVMSEVEDGKPFSQVVRSAKNLGYTEPGLVYCIPASVEDGKPFTFTVFC